MIGKVVFPYRSRRADAVMDDDGTWRCDAIPCLARPLNLLFSPRVVGAPLDPSWSRRRLQEVAVWLRGETGNEPVEFPSSLQPDPSSGPCHPNATNDDIA